MKLSSSSVNRPYWIGDKDRKYETIQKKKSTARLYTSSSLIQRRRIYIAASLHLAEYHHHHYTLSSLENYSTH
ncbi:hypothetical protein T4D_1109 [Trichinella pseudospiralis]|uniref:Uncharacterized protein n=1 Tax=Trichinella pseudospiralis TaxID=6337 RepID=A0A0V1FVS8_TRIPS|nr:hypothetical protein T4D_1109 [Trichinella pseudospiralis]